MGAYVFPRSVAFVALSARAMRAYGLTFLVRVQKARQGVNRKEHWASLKGDHRGGNDPSFPPENQQEEGAALKEKV